MMTTATTALYREALRPQFHFTPALNWTNDPNGLVYYEGEYHLFFQHNPSGIEWGNMTWGHAVSPDLLHWTQLANAIEPDRLGTIYSGSAVVDGDNTAGFQNGNEKTLVAFYTAAGEFSTEGREKGVPYTQCLAYSTDRGRTWSKYADNPILGHLAGANRDPKVVWHATTKKWIMTLYLDKNQFAFFASPDLKHWTHLQTIDVPGCAECPDFFELPVEGQPGQTKWVWTSANGRYVTGDFDGARFTPDPVDPDGSISTLQVEFGGNCYAGQTWSDLPASDGRRIYIAWMAGGQYPGMPFNQQMTFPCELRLRATPDGPRLFKTPIREIEKLRGPAPESPESHEWTGLTLQPGENPLAGITGDTCEIRVELTPGDAQECGLVVRGAPIRYSVKDRTLTCLGHTAPLDLVGDKLKLQILVDRASLEVFANNGRATLSSCFLPPAENKSLELFTVGGHVQVDKLRVYKLRTIWE